MITKAEILMGRDKLYPEEYTKEISDNIDKLLKCVNYLRQAYGAPMTVSSGWRPAAVNAATPNAAKKSNHMLGLAVDFKDKDGTLDAWCMSHQALLLSFGLYLEHPDSTIGWCHLQCVPPKSGKRVFIP
jgi:hypothetical protein